MKKETQRETALRVLQARLLSLDPEQVNIFEADYYSFSGMLLMAHLSDLIMKAEEDELNGKANLLWKVWINKVHDGE